MDPRHPELALSRLKELIKQYDEIEYRISHATTSAGISQAEREGGLVVQEMCLVAPRIHEAMMQASRNRRHDLTHGILIEPQDVAVETPQGGMFEPEIVEEEEEEELTFEQQAIKYTLELDKEIEEREKQEAKSKPKPKKTTRKKTTKKKADK